MLQVVLFIIGLLNLISPDLVQKFTSIEIFTSRCRDPSYKVEKWTSSGHTPCQLSQKQFLNRLNHLDCSSIPLNRSATSKARQMTSTEKNSSHRPAFADESEGADLGACDVSTKVMSYDKDCLGPSTDDDLVPLSDDVYNLFFLSHIGSQGFFYAVSVFLLKMTLYTVLAMDAIEAPLPEEIPKRVMLAQVLMLPVAVSMQDDLISTYFIVGNVKFSVDVKKEHPGASKAKFHIANLCRGVDGAYSLLINFVILMKAEQVLSLFLNFAALQFLQSIDNVALDMAASGYLTEHLEDMANSVKNTALPKKNSSFFKMMDSVLFASTYILLIIAWIVITVRN